jgi:glucose/mannose transport system substrate-binding protein
VRMGMPMDKFDDCAKDSMVEFVSSAKSGTLVPSMAHGMAVRSSVQGAIFDLVTQFVNSDMSPEDAARKLADSVAAVKG